MKGYRYTKVGTVTGSAGVGLEVNGPGYGHTIYPLVPEYLAARLTNIIRVAEERAYATGYEDAQRDTRRALREARKARLPA